MSEPDVLVVGGGLGGVTAALAAVDTEETATVRLVAPREHPFDAHSGLVDVLGSIDDDDEPVARPRQALESLAPDHPYRRFGSSALEAGLSLFDRATAGTYEGAYAETNGLVPTAIGGCRPAARYPAAVSAGLCSRTDEMGLVGFDSLPDFDPFQAAERLEAMQVPFDVTAIRLSLPLDMDGPPPLALAELLDDDASIGRGIPIRDSVTRGARPKLGDVDRIGFPAVLGIGDPAAVHATLAADLDAEIFEVPLGAPSVLGRRLEATLFDALAEAGVDVSRGVDVTDVSADDGRIRGVSVDDGTGAEMIEPSAVVLATGGPAAGGIVADRDGAREPRFGCHVPHPADRGQWTVADPLGSHPLASFGVRVDDATRPTTADGEPAYGNLFAAGRVIGGHDVVAQHSVGGVALATGAAAGRAAVDDAGPRFAG